MVDKRALPFVKATIRYRSFIRRAPVYSGPRSLSRTEEERAAVKNGSRGAPEHVKNGSEGCRPKNCPHPPSLPLRLDRVRQRTMDSDVRRFFPSRASSCGGTRAHERCVRAANTPGGMVSTLERVSHIPWVLSRLVLLHVSVSALRSRTPRLHRCVLSSELRRSQ